ncbi:MAG: PAS domain-containing protein [Deltaproteobacteria bacterium]|nr:PAS domain-containing protein [Deltaproteobacteria bacterium]
MTNLDSFGLHDPRALLSSLAASVSDDPTSEGPQVARLESAFEAFHETAELLGGRYVTLTESLRDLEQRLEARNRELARTLAAEREVRLHLHTVVETLGAGLLVADADRKVTLANRAARELLEHGALDGAALETLLPGTLRVVDDAHAPRRPRRETLEQLLAGKSGTVVAEGPLGPTGRTEARLVITRRTDASPDARYVVVLHDETRLRKLESELRRRERLAAVGTASGQIVHQIRSPVTSLELLTSLLAEGLGDDPVHGEIVQDIRASLKRLERTLSNLLHFLGSGRIEPRDVSLREVLERALLAVPKNQIQGAVDFRVSVAPIDLTASVDPDLIDQVLINLITNAVQAMPGGGSLALTAAPASAADHEGSFVRITVEDSGNGIPPAQLERIFDPFVTGRARGTGLGLTLAHNVVEAHGGTLEITSEPGRGTCVTIWLPVASASSERAHAALTPHPADLIDA